MSYFLPKYRRIEPLKPDEKDFDENVSYCLVSLTMPKKVKEELQQGPMLHYRKKIITHCRGRRARYQEVCFYVDSKCGLSTIEAHSILGGPAQPCSTYLHMTYLVLWTIGKASNTSRCLTKGSVQKNTDHTISITQGYIN